MTEADRIFLGFRPPGIGSGIAGLSAECVTMKIKLQAASS